MMFMVDEKHDVTLTQVINFAITPHSLEECWLCEVYYWHSIIVSEEDTNIVLNAHGMSHGTIVG